MTGFTVFDNLENSLYLNGAAFHIALIAALAVAAIGIVVSVTRRRVLGIGLAIVLPALTAFGLVLLAGVLATRSSARDVATRVHDVGMALPKQATRIQTRSGDNVRRETYALSGDLQSVSRATENSVKAAFHGVGITVGGALGYALADGSPSDLTVSFLGRDGCDGTVDVRITLTAGNGATTAHIDGHCED